MKLLIFSDLHLCDKRNSVEYERRRMAMLAEWILSSADAVLNLGDTVSRREWLRPEYASEADGYDQYLRWRGQFTIPFVECAVDREFSFFAEKLGQEPDSFRVLDRHLSLITAAPKEAADHRFVPEQLDFLEKSVRGCPTPRVLIATHVPYPGSCSRPVAPGIFLEIPERLRRIVEESAKEVYWCGGHFHWPEEPPRRFGSLTAFYGARFSFENEGKPGYLRMFDTESGKITTVLAEFDW